MTALQMIHTRLSELSKEELFELLETVTHSLKSQTIGQESNRDAIQRSLEKSRRKNHFAQISDPVLWQKQLRSEWGE